jgi:hypothetical protein
MALMRITRRQAWGVLGAAAAPLPGASAQGWTAEWDRALVAAALDGFDPAYDPRARMLTRRIGGDYNYHSSLRNTTAHPTRDSLEYALLLLEDGGEERAARARDTISQVISLQDADPASKWYGIWGYYLEEPPPRMTPADWNWADFNGGMLLVIEGRHGARLGGALRRAVRESIRHAACSVRRRNVHMGYTNIAVKGTFVTLAAAELLGDADLNGYATDRMRRLAAAIDATGSIAEYNSPTYAQVTLGNLARIRMLVKNPAMLEAAARIERRVWLHLAKHWHAGSGQLAGPMSRAYGSEIGQPLWLQKALGGRLEFAKRNELRGLRTGDTGVLDFRCPEELAAPFLEPGPARQHRELFTPGVQGTTYLAPAWCLGSVNRGDFWIQRRPLLAYWGGGRKMAGYLQARFLKDDYDFASALLYSAQERGWVLGLVNFRSEGGDRHPGLDRVQGGAFTAARLRLRFDLAGVPLEAVRVAGNEATIAAGPATIRIAAPASSFNGRAGRLSAARESGVTTLSLDLMREERPRPVRWSELGEAFAAFTLAFGEAGGELRRDVRDGVARLRWKTPGGELCLAAATRVAPLEDQNRVYEGLLDGSPIPFVRLSEERLG